MADWCTDEDWSDESDWSSICGASSDSNRMGGDRAIRKPPRSNG